ncbi:MAG TPA: glucodextranase DOMON-like domain-containing protein [Thermoanaerobaculaceae bacterium]|nr:glucodextranase DOMON-like domain-containing protein [Thermoanaerobaculaceae bacterium]HPS77690.1 glucodextranase DOMON-like domain-containing protein [Thermoanaerobaculaceae bacterium]
MTRTWHCAVLAAAVVLVAGSVLAQEVVLKDPAGDDFGPGTYIYPTDAVYKAGSFDLRQLKVVAKGDKVNLEVTVGTDLADPWGMGGGFAVQMAFVFIQTDPAAAGLTKTYPGLNVQFAPDSKWQKCVIMSPQSPGRVKTEVETKAPDLLSATVIPTRTRGSGRVISTQVALADLGGGDPTKWRYQVLMQSNEGYPAATDLLTRKVNEFEGQHRFGGGNDGDCDPHVMDLFAGAAMGDKEEIELQKKMLAYECAPDGSVKSMATLTMVGGAAK